MRANALNIFVAVGVAFLLGWWLWEAGIDTPNQPLSAVVGSIVICLQLIGAIGFKYDYPRSGAQIKLLNMICVAVTFAYSLLASYAAFGAAAYCVPVLLLLLIDVYASVKIYSSRM